MLLLLGRTSPAGHRARPGMGEVLRPREGERPYRRRVPHPIHRRSPPSDNHGPRCPHGRSDRPRLWAGTPLSTVGASAADPPGGDPTDPRTPAGDRAEGIGPSVADRGPFTALTQGGSLLASNGPITTGRQGGIERRRRVARKGHRNGGKLPGNRTEQYAWLTASNSLHLCQVLVKRRLTVPVFGVGTEKRPHCPVGSAAVLSHRHNRARPEGDGGPGQNRTRASAVRAAVTLGSSGPITSNSSSSRSRAVFRSSPAVRRTASTSRPKASST